MQKANPNRERFLHPGWMWCLFWAVMLVFPKRDCLLSVEDVVYGYSLQPSWPAIAAGACITLAELAFAACRYREHRELSLSEKAFPGLQLLMLTCAAVPSSAGFCTVAVYSGGLSFHLVS